MESLEEALCFLALVAEPVAKDAEVAGGVAEAAGGFGGVEPLEEVGAQRLVLTVGHLLRREEEATFRTGRRYRIAMTDRHAAIILSSPAGVKWLCGSSRSTTTYSPIPW